MVGGSRTLKDANTGTVEASAIVKTWPIIFFKPTHIEDKTFLFGNDIKLKCRLSGHLADTLKKHAF